VKLEDRPLVTAPTKKRKGKRTDGYLDLKDYAALGDGRSVALSGADGSIDWWCVPNMDSPPLFDRLLSPENGGFFSIVPEGPFAAEQRYRDSSNVHETLFTTQSGTARLTESLNSGSAGRLPWCELGRRVEGIEGCLRFRFHLRLGTMADSRSPYCVETIAGPVFHIGDLMVLFRHSDAIEITARDDRSVEGWFEVSSGERRVFGLIAGEDEPLVVPAVADVDRRIDISDAEWREWADRIGYDGPHHELVVRSALALKLLLYSPSGAIAAAATTSLPEAVDGEKNYDYRYAWVRDAGYTIKAFLRIGSEMEAKAALTWLLERLDAHGPKVMFTLDGRVAPAETRINVDGWRRTGPVRVGNNASHQHQHAIYGDIFETVERFVACGNILNPRAGEMLARLADRCADHWREKDSGIWELPEEQHFTNSKLSCWQALARAVELADQGQLPAARKERWARERDRIAAWINAHCWSEERQTFLAHPNADGIDASMALAARFRFCSEDRLALTIKAIDRELGAGAFHYRYTGMDKEEGCFLACTFWVAEAKALLGDEAEANRCFNAAIAGLGGGTGIYPEMIDPRSAEYLGNLPQGLTHLALIQAASNLAGAPL